ncbi:MAG: PTS sugar transporter subunit IIA [Candidatus Puniceispirillum sp.]
MSAFELPAATQIMVGLDASSKKQLVEQLAERAADITGLPRRTFFDAIMRRERLGSTAVGDGIALPHIMHPELRENVTILAILDKPVDFDAADKKPVDIICLVAGSENSDVDHLKYLSGMARLLRSDNRCQKLRQASSIEGVMQCFQHPKHAAA